MDKVIERFQNSDYDYATNGFTGDGASGTAIDSLRMVGTLSLTANGIYLDNSNNLWLSIPFIIRLRKFVTLKLHSE